MFVRFPGQQVSLASTQEHSKLKYSEAGGNLVKEGVEIARKIPKF